MRWDDSGHFICELQLPLFNVWILELEIFFHVPSMEMEVFFELVCCGLYTNDLDEYRILNRTDTRKYIMIMVFLNHILYYWMWCCSRNGNVHYFVPC